VVSIASRKEDCGFQSPHICRYGFILHYYWNFIILRLYIDYILHLRWRQMNVTFQNRHRLFDQMAAILKDKNIGFTYRYVWCMENWAHNIFIDISYQGRNYTCRCDTSSGTCKQRPCWAWIKLKTGWCGYTLIGNRPVFNIMNSIPGVKFAPRDELCPLRVMFTPLFTHRGEHSLLLRRMERQKENFTPRGQRLLLGDNFTPGCQSLPQGRS
jgi:hypothetical protein